jgi:hypothetical protein
MIVGVGEQTLGSLLENFHLNTFISAGVCLGDLLGHPIVMGKSMLMRRSDLQLLGGLSAGREHPGRGLCAWLPHASRWAHGHTVVASGVDREPHLERQSRAQASRSVGADASLRAWRKQGRDSRSGFRDCPIKPDNAT